MDHAEMEKRFSGYIADPSFGSNIVDLELRKVVAILGLAVIELDKTSSALAKTNVKLATTYTWLTAVLVLVGIIQIALMFRGH